MSDTLTWPLRVTKTGRFATAEQGSEADKTSRVFAILSTPEGWMHDNPDFGCPPVLFQTGGVDPSAILAAVVVQEPQATPEIIAGLIDATGVQAVSVNADGPARGPALPTPTPQPFGAFRVSQMTRQLWLIEQALDRLTLADVS